MTNLAVELYKAIIVGAPSVGKSSLVRRYQTGEFKETHTATVAADLSAITFDFPEGKVVLTVVDVGGQETDCGSCTIIHNRVMTPLKKGRPKMTKNRV